MKWISKPLLGAQLNWAHPLNKGLVGYWLFNEGMGDKANDLSMNGNVGTLSGMAFPSTTSSGWNPGHKGVGLNFDGVNDCVDAGNRKSLQIDGDVTLSVHLKHSIGEGYLIGKGIGNDNTQMWYLRINFDNRIEFIGGNSSENGMGFDVLTIDTISNNTWNYLVGTISGNTANIYINGKISKSELVTSRQSNAGNVLIGKRVDDWIRFTGALDKVCIYNRALSAQEIMELYIDPYGMFL